MSIPIKFSNPPIVEVAFGVEFDFPGEPLSSAYLGLYWQTIQERFPLTQDQPVDLDNFQGKFPLPKVVFGSEDESQIIQLQEKYFLYNWRYENQKEYPHFEKIFSDFSREWESFNKWWLEITNETLTPTKYLLGYINLIDKDFGWNDAIDHSKIFTFVGNTNQSLGIPRFHDVKIVFILPEERGNLIIDLDQQYESIENQQEEQKLFFRLTAVSLDNKHDLIEWFQSVHGDIFKTFLDLTTENAHQQWGLE